VRVGSPLPLVSSFRRLPVVAIIRNCRKRTVGYKRNVQFLSHKLPALEGTVTPAAGFDRKGARLRALVSVNRVVGFAIKVRGADSTAADGHAAGVG
jgi:hypothetical protein